MRCIFAYSSSSISFPINRVNVGVSMNSTSRKIRQWRIVSNPFSLSTFNQESQLINVRQNICSRSVESPWRLSAARGCRRPCPPGTGPLSLIIGGPPRWSFPCLRKSPAAIFNRRDAKSTERRSRNRVDARTFLSAATFEPSVAPKTSVPRRPPASFSQAANKPNYCRAEIPLCFTSLRSSRLGG